MCRVGTGSFGRDIAVCTAALRTTKGDATLKAMLYRQRAKALRFRDQCDAALLDVDESIALIDWSAAAYIERSRVNACLGRVNDALTDSKNAIELSPFAYDAWRERGIQEFYLGRFDDAVDSLSQSIELNHYNSEAYAFRGFAFYATGQYEDAAWDFKTCDELRFAWAPIHVWRFLSTIRAQRNGDKLMRRELKELLPDEWPRALWVSISQADLDKRAPDTLPLKERVFWQFVHGELEQVAGNATQRKRLHKQIRVDLAEHAGQPFVESVLIRHRKTP